MPPENYSLETEVKQLTSAADASGLDRFLLYGHSAGGAIAPRIRCNSSERILGLGLDEPASDFSGETKEAWARVFRPIEQLSSGERVTAFLRAQVAPGVELPKPTGSQPDWMASRPAGIEAFTTALDSNVLVGSLSAFTGPVYYSFGSLTNPIWSEMRNRLGLAFPNFTSEEYEGLHHLNTSNAAQPGRVAAALRRVWQNAL